MERFEYKFEVRFQAYEDGHLRVWSPDVPGFFLSHTDHAAVLADIEPALEAVLGAQLNRKVRVRRLRELAERDSDTPVPPIKPSRSFCLEAA